MRFLYYNTQKRGNKNEDTSEKFDLSYYRCHICFDFLSDLWSSYPQSDLCRLVNWGGDLTQHYLGWVAYRKSAWHFPIGMTNQLSYPEWTSIIYTDSIPVFAVFFKLLSPLLPQDFQYFGLWGILCFILQGCLCARIIEKYTDNQIYLVISSCLFVLTPVMINRMYFHTALAGQWLILLILEPIFNYDQYRNNLKKLLRISALTGVLAASIHIYFLAFCGIILVGVMLFDFLNKKSIKRILLTLCSYLIPASIVVALLGGFQSSIVMSKSGLGVYSFNLNSFFNPLSWSVIYNNLSTYADPTYGDGQYEGFAWLGAGCILLLVLALFSLFSRRDVKGIFIRNSRTLISLAVVFVIAVFVAASPIVTFGNQVLFELTLPDWITDIWSIFRASGRFSWICVYIIILCSCIVLASTGKETVAMGALTCCLLLQGYDLSEILIQKNETYNQVTTYKSPLAETKFWTAVGENETIQHVVFVDSLDTSILLTFGDWAMTYDKTLNNFYFARTQETVTENTQEALMMLPEEDVFIFDSSSSNDLILGLDLYFYEMDGIIVGLAEPVEGYEALDTESLEQIWEFGDNFALSNGEDTEEGRVVYPQGRSYGPFWTVPAGDYIVEINGENFNDELLIRLYTDQGTVEYDYNLIEQTDTGITIEFTLDETVLNFEVSIENDSEEDILLTKLEIFTMS